MWRAYYLFLLALLVLSLGYGLVFNALAARISKEPPLVAKEIITLQTAQGPLKLRVGLTRPGQPLNPRLRNLVSAGLSFLQLYQTPTDRGVNAADYPVSASVAFLSREGVILRIMEVAPCAAAHRPGVVYRGRLEVESGWFARNGVRVGDRVVTQTPWRMITQAQP